mmetsp:Transcript_19119/g.22022  ORF Transcript_19119/g.22022 Transcript_19119/m.22022 type:complete len:92 (-) Transcript_19119:542-817(-)
MFGFISQLKTQECPSLFAHLHIPSNRLPMTLLACQYGSIKAKRKEEELEITLKKNRILNPLLKSSNQRWTDAKRKICVLLDRTEKKCPEMM